VLDPAFADFLSQPLSKERGDVNLNLERIPALHNLLGGEGNLASVAESCFAYARHHVEQVTDVVEASRRAGQKVSRDTEKLIAQSQARTRAAGLVVDPSSLASEIAISRAIEAAVSAPVLRVSSVSVVVVSAQSWKEYV
jgi:ATP-dependent helicase HepA